MKYENPQIIPVKGDALEYDSKWEDQFNNPEIIPVEGGEMKVIDIKPEKQKSEIPAVYMRGWATTADIYKENIKEIARDGRRALVVDEPAGIDSKNLPPEDQDLVKSMEDVIPMADVELRKVAAFMKLINEKQLDQVDLVMHSEGAIYGSFAAILHPDRVRDLIFIDPAGLVGQDSNKIVLRAILDFQIEMGHALLNVDDDPTEMKKVISSQREKWMKAFLENPKHIIESVGAIGKTEIQDLISILRQLGKKIAVIQGANDKMFPSVHGETEKSIQDNIDSSMVDGFYSVEGTHESSFIEAVKFSKVINHALNSLEALNQKAGQEQIEEKIAA